MTLVLNHISHYKFGKSQDDEELREQKPPKMERLRERFNEEGTVKSVRVVLLAHDHNHPYFFIIQNKETSEIMCPGGKLQAGEEDEAGINRILAKKLFGGEQKELNIGEHIATWYRPQFTEHWYPYLPTHITVAKEIEKWYVISLPEELRFRTNQKHELAYQTFYSVQGKDNIDKRLAAIPALLSRFDISYREETA